MGVLLILMWTLPFWWLAHSLSELNNPPSVAAVTTTIVVAQTLIGLLGFWVVGTASKAAWGKAVFAPSRSYFKCALTSALK
jgi:hypothetical protein